MYSYLPISVLKGLTVNESMNYTDVNMFAPLALSATLPSQPASLSPANITVISADSTPIKLSPKRLAKLPSSSSSPLKNTSSPVTNTTTLPYLSNSHATQSQSPQRTDTLESLLAFKSTNNSKQQQQQPSHHQSNLSTSSDSDLKINTSSPFMSTASSVSVYKTLGSSQSSTASEDSLDSLMMPIARPLRGTPPTRRSTVNMIITTQTTESARISTAVVFSPQQETETFQKINNNSSNNNTNNSNSSTAMSLDDLMSMPHPSTYHVASNNNNNKGDNETSSNTSSNSNSGNSNGEREDSRGLSTASQSQSLSRPQSAKSTSSNSTSDTNSSNTTNNNNKNNNNSTSDAKISSLTSNFDLLVSSPSDSSSLLSTPSSFSTYKTVSPNHTMEGLFSYHGDSTTIYSSSHTSTISRSDKDLLSTPSSLSSSSSSLPSPTVSSPSPSSSVSTSRMDETERYEGEYNTRTKKRHGKGKLFLTDRLTQTAYLFYDGNFRDGHRDGKGKEFDNRGRLVYDGDWSAGQRSGKGREYCGNAITYDGEWKNNLYHGSASSPLAFSCFFSHFLVLLLSVFPSRLSLSFSLFSVSAVTSSILAPSISATTPRASGTGSANSSATRDWLTRAVGPRILNMDRGENFPRPRSAKAAILKGFATALLRNGTHRALCMKKSGRTMCVCRRCWWPTTR
jgi:hypothetical protein